MTIDRKRKVAMTVLMGLKKGRITEIDSRNLFYCCCTSIIIDNRSNTEYLPQKRIRYYGENGNYYEGRNHLSPGGNIERKITYHKKQ